MELTKQTMTATISAGRIRVDAGRDLTFEGTIDGSIEVAPGSVLRMRGRHHGPLTVPLGATVEICESGEHVGPLHVDGVVHNSGSRSGPRYGGGEVVDLPGSSVG